MLGLGFDDLMPGSNGPLRVTAASDAPSATAKSVLDDDKRQNSVQAANPNRRLKRQQSFSSPLPSSKTRATTTNKHFLGEFHLSPFPPLQVGSLGLHLVHNLLSSCLLPGSFPSSFFLHWLGCMCIFYPLDAGFVDTVID